MKRIKINEKQAKLLKEMREASNKVLKITEAQYNKILAMEGVNITKEDNIAGVNIPKNKVPSNSVTNNFSKGLDKGVKKDIGKLYEEFLHELYNLHEGGETKFDKLIKLMEVSGLIENRRIKKSKFNNSKDKVKSVISRGLHEFSNGSSQYRVMEVIEEMLTEEPALPAGSEFDSNAPWNEPSKDDSTEKDLVYNKVFELIYYNPKTDGVSVFNKGGEIYIHMNGYHHEDLLIDYCDNPTEPSEDCIEFFINSLNNENRLNIGSNPFKDILIQVDNKNKRKLLRVYGDDQNLVEILSNISETTTAASSGSFEQPMGMQNKFNSNVNSELDETTTVSSVGGESGTFAYDAPVGDNSDFWTKGNKLNKRMNESNTEDRARYTTLMSMYKSASGNDKEDLKIKLKKAADKIGIELQLDENAMTDTQYPGGEFVELDDCTKLNNNKVAQNGGCNQGDSGVVKTRKSSKSVISKNV